MFNGTLASSNTVTFRIANTNSVTINGANSGLTGTVALDLTGSGTAGTLYLGNDQALGSSTLSFTSSDTLASTGPRTIANKILLAGDGTIGGTNAITFNGSVTSSASSSRIVYINNTGGTTFAGPVNLAPDDGSTKGLTIAGSSPLLISGSIANGTGNTVASPLIVTNTGGVNVNSVSTYTGTTTITSGGILTVGSSGALGTGNVTVGGSGTNPAGTLTLTNGASISDSATLGFYETATINLNGPSGSSETVYALKDLTTNATFADGYYSGSYLNSKFPSVFQSANGEGITVVSTPEPTSLLLMGLAAGPLVFARRKR